MKIVDFTISLNKYYIVVVNQYIVDLDGLEG